MDSVFSTAQHAFRELYPGGKVKVTRVAPNLACVELTVTSRTYMALDSNSPGEEFINRSRELEHNIERIFDGAS